MNAHSPSLGRRDLLLATALGLAVMLSRLPFVGRVLYHWDSVNFALALQRFDVAAGQPHVPGYILYVALGRLVALLGGDAQHTLASISVVSGGAAVALLYLLGSFMFSRPAGAIAAWLLATSPLFWFYNEVALPHSLDLAAIVVCVGLLERIRVGRTRNPVTAAIALGIAGGLRPQTQVFLAPLAVYATWRLDGRSRLTGLAVLAVVDLAWFVPLTQSAGGMARYFAITSAFQARFTTSTSLFLEGGLRGLQRNLLKLTIYTAYALGFGALPLGVAVTTLRRSAWRMDSRLIVLALWALPSLAYYATVHMGQQGLVFVFLPAIFLGVGAALSIGQAWLRWRWLVAAAGIANAALFLVAPTYPLGGDRVKILSRDTLQEHDAFWLSRSAAVEAHFDPKHSVLLSSMWRIAGYYLPGYAVVPFGLTPRWEVGEGQPSGNLGNGPLHLPKGVTPDASGAIAVILLEDSLLPFNHSSDRVERVSLVNGGQLAYMRLRADETLSFGDASYGIATPPR